MNNLRRAIDWVWPQCQKTPINNQRKKQMKTSKWIMAGLMVVTLASIMIAVSGCKEKESSQSQSPSTNQTVQYTCPMHPDVVQDKPGKCPKCGMDLVEKK
jgi:Heavy metal binding domain